jgi:hypothetical protein
MSHPGSHSGDALAARMAPTRGGRSDRKRRACLQHWPAPTRVNGHRASWRAPCVDTRSKRHLDGTPVCLAEQAFCRLAGWNPSRRTARSSSFCGQRWRNLCSPSVGKDEMVRSIRNGTGAHHRQTRAATFPAAGLVRRWTVASRLPPSLAAMMVSGVADARCNRVLG